MKTNHHGKTRRHRSKQGAALGLVLVVLLVVSFMGAALLNLGGVASVETSKDLSKDQAFWLAEAGLEEAKTIARKNRDIHGETMAFPSSEPRSWSGSLQYGSYQVDVTEDGASPPSFTIVSEGLSQGGLRQVVSLALNQVSAISMGIFGDKTLTLQPNNSVYSYHSSSGLPPTPENSTGDAQIGSNDTIDLQLNVNSVLDGEISQGADPLEQEPAELCPPNGDCGGDVEVQYVGYVDPDPLGLFGDTSNPLNLSGNFQSAQSGNNDNGSVTNIVNNQLHLGNGEVATLTAGDYYLSSAHIPRHAILDVDASAGPVNIYLSGSMEADPNSAINLMGGDPADFRIIANGSSPDDRIYFNKIIGDFNGFIYAPEMLVHLQPNGDINGAVWAGEASIYPGGEIYIDMDALDYDVFKAYTIAWGTWQQVPP